MVVCATFTLSLLLQSALSAPPPYLQFDGGVQYPGVNLGVTATRSPSNHSSICEDDDGNLGICTCSSECNKMLGRNGGKTCGKGEDTMGTVCPAYDFQVCCLFEASCGSRVDEPIVYFQNPKYPQPLNDDLSCHLDLLVRPNVDQLRVDFLKFELPAPDTDGVCLSQNRLSVYAPQLPLGILGPGADSLCGTNTDNHLYIPVSQGEYVQFIFTLDGTEVVPLATTRQVSSNTEVRWNIRVTQVEKNSPDLRMAAYEAPDGCNQYITEDVGNLKSFNFDGLSVFGPNQDYSVCLAGIGGGERPCGVTLRPIAFGLPVNTRDVINRIYRNEVTGKKVKPEDDECADCATGYVGDHECCTNDYSSFISVITKDSTLRTKYCGKKAGGLQQFSASSEPYVIRVRSGAWNEGKIPRDKEIPSGTNGYIGFNIEYKFNTGMC